MVTCLVSSLFLDVSVFMLFFCLLSFPFAFAPLLRTLQPSKPTMSSRSSCLPGLGLQTVQTLGHQKPGGFVGVLKVVLGGQDEQYLLGFLLGNCQESRICLQELSKVRSRRGTKFPGRIQEFQIRSR